MRQTFERCEDLEITCIVRSEFKTVGLRNCERKLERIDRVEPHAFAKKWFFKGDAGWLYFEV